MARLPRFVILGQPQHVIQRGNNRDVIFVADEDYHYYLKKLEDACKKYDCDIHAYVLMTNHVHLPSIKGSASLKLIKRKQKDEGQALHLTRS